MTRRWPAAVSEADAEMYEVSVGDVLPEVNSAYNAVDFRVTGIYDIPDPTEPYWFDMQPDRSLGIAAAPTSTSRWPTCSWSPSRAWCSGASASGGCCSTNETVTRTYQDSLDLRVDADAVTSDDVAGLREIVADLQEEADGTDAALITSMDDTFDYLDDAWQVTATTMIVTTAQVGVLALAVLAMLVSVALIQRRPEVGLSRLRGRSFGSLVRSLAGQWTAVVTGRSGAGGRGRLRRRRRRSRRSGCPVRPRSRHLPGSCCRSGSRCSPRSCCWC